MPRLELELLRNHIPYEDHGTGRTIVLFHGGPGADSAYLRPLAAALATEFRVVSYDQRRAPTSGPEQVALPWLLYDIDTLVAVLGLSPAILLGHSWGAALATAFAHVRPDAVQALVLVNALCPSTWSDQLGSFVERRLASPGVAEFLAAQEKEFSKMPREERSHHLLRATCRVPLVHDLTRWRELPDASLDEEWQARLWASVAQSVAGRSALHPGLVVQGQDDACEASAVIAAMGNPTWESAVLPACGHVAPVECTEDLSRLVSAFANRVAHAPLAREYIGDRPAAR